MGRGCKAMVMVLVSLVGTVVSLVTVVALSLVLSPTNSVRQKKASELVVLPFSPDLSPVRSPVLIRSDQRSRLPARLRKRVLVQSVLLDA